MESIKKYTISEPFLDLNCQLGEAPFFDRPRNTLRFVDILGKQLHTIKIGEGPSSHAELNLPFSIGTTADIEGDEARFIFGGKFGFGILSKDTHSVEQIKTWPVDTVSNESAGKDGATNFMRSNDGAVDSKGRYWVGVMG